MASFRKVEAYVEEWGKPPLQSHPVLGPWCDTQRRAKKGQGNGLKMTEARIALLEGLTNAEGDSVWFWDFDVDEGWMASFDDLVAYVDEHKRFPSKGTHEVLYQWVKTQRNAKKGKGKMTDKRIALLEALPGWEWAGVFPRPDPMKTLIAKARAAGTFPPRPPTDDEPTDDEPIPRPPKRPRTTTTLAASSAPAASVSPFSTGQDDIDDPVTVEVGDTPEENEDESDDDDDGDELWISLSDDDSVFIHSIESPFDPKQDRRAL